MNQDTQARHDAAVLSDVKEWHARHGRRLQHDTLTATEIARWAWNKARDQWESAVEAHRNERVFSARAGIGDRTGEIRKRTREMVRAARRMNAAQAAWVAAVDADIELSDGGSI